MVTDNVEYKKESESPRIGGQRKTCDLLRSSVERRETNFILQNQGGLA